MRAPRKWRCRDSNPGPPTDPPQLLRAYPAVLFSSLAHRPAGGLSRTSRGSLARAVTAPNAGQPDFSDTRRPASGRADRKMGGKEPVRASTYAARAKLSFAGNVSWRFNECSKHLGTQPRIHRTRRNQSSPEPVLSINACNLAERTGRVNVPLLQRLMPSLSVSLRLCVRCFYQSFLTAPARRRFAGPRPRGCARRPWRGRGPRQRA